MDRYDREFITSEVRMLAASQLLAGLLANPNVVSGNPNCGWCLVNASDSEIAAYAVKLADELIAATAARAASEEG